MKAHAYASHGPDKHLLPYEFERREPLDTDVEIAVKFCGVCHSDIHTARGEWGEINYPCIPGHEIVGIVTRVGKTVTSFKPGDTAAVGCMVNSCGTCDQCKKGLEQYCNEGPVWTYSSADPIDGSDTKGGYSSLIVVTEKFVIPVPIDVDLAKIAPLLCAGITTYSPLKHWNVQAGMRVGILGLGGLGHMAVKYAKAMGAYVGVITSSPEKADDARKYGADEVIISSNENGMDQARRTYDLIIDTIPSEHDLTPYLDLLDVDGSIVLVGPINPMPGFHGGDLMGGRISIAGSNIGGLQETKEMLDFSIKHDIYPDIDFITMDYINQAWDNMVNKAMSHRYVIDIENSFK